MVSIHADDILLATSPELKEEMETSLEDGLVIKWGDDITQEGWSRYLGGREWHRTENGFEIRAPVRYV